MDPVQAATTLLSPAMIAAYGPWGAVLILMGTMLFSWMRGRDERLAKLNEAYTASLRQDQRELFERQAEVIESLKVDKTTLEARLRETQNLCAALRNCCFDQYMLHREAYHAAIEARAALIAVGLKKPEDFQALIKPEPPQTHSIAAE